MSRKIAIIGGGITGLYIGWKLSQKGESIVIFERKKEEEADFKCCSGLVSERIRNFIPIEEGMIKNRIDHCKIIFPHKKVSLFFNPNHLALDREKVVRSLIDLNKKSGAMIHFGESISEIPSGFDKVIICDGANSFYRRKQNDEVNFKLGAQLILKESSNDNFVETYPTRSGFCWKIPRGDRVEYGVLSDYRDINDDLDKFLDKCGVDKGSGEFYSAVIPQPKFSFDSLFFSKDRNILVCGDSMGLTKPWSGGGIIWGFTAADILIKNIDDASRYEREMKEKFYFQILKGKVSNAVVKILGNYFPFFLPNRVTYDNDFPNMIKSIIGLIKR
ncbi:MAG: NAD(P)-binding protein [Candidatus Pacebacteria bacterium]|nr:NAD(P)-binding protein [Candidatus Paceibacterota bacterium]